MSEYYRQIVNECLGCARIAEDRCSMYMFPYLQHSRINGCAGRTHNRTKQVSSEKPINPMKASKRAVGVIK